ncbi:MAG: ABC transporter ATP-binding protein [Bacteroidales bacterium]|nr:ABC transporter ATP-binding protein [Bacteroidales bacterium]
MLSVSPDSSALLIDGLAVGYGTGRHRHTVGSDLCAALPPKSLTCLVGVNGAGKSTLLRTLSGLLPPLAGSVEIMGKRIESLSVRQMSTLLSIVLTARPDTGHLTVEETVAAGRMPYTPLSGRLSETDQKLVDEAMRLTGTAHLRNRALASLSDGERQRVMIAKSLAQDTPLILLDEPTAFLDFPGKIGTLRLLQSLAHDRGKTILLSTHDLEPAFRLADRLWLLTPGGLLSGTPRALAADDTLARYFAADGIKFDSDQLRFVY